MLFLIIAYFLCMPSATTAKLGWSEAYVEAVLDARQCMNNSYIAIFDSLFIYSPDMELSKLYYARGLNHFAARLQRMPDTCLAIMDAVTFIYRDMQYGRQEQLNLQYHEEEKALRDEASRKVITNGGTAKEAEEAAKAVAQRPQTRPRNVVKDDRRDLTIEHIQQMLTNNVVRPACDRVEVTPLQFGVMSRCLREKRKDAIAIKIDFNL